MHILVYQSQDRLSRSLVGILGSQGITPAYALGFMGHRLGSPSHFPLTILDGAPAKDIDFAKLVDDGKRYVEGNGILLGLNDGAKVVASIGGATVKRNGAQPAGFFNVDGTPYSLRTPDKYQDHMFKGTYLPQVVFEQTDPRVVKFPEGVAVTGVDLEGSVRAFRCGNKLAGILSRIDIGYRGVLNFLNQEGVPEREGRTMLEVYYNNEPKTDRILRQTVLNMLHTNGHVPG